MLSARSRGRKAMSQLQNPYDKADMGTRSGAFQAPTDQLALPVLVLGFPAGALAVLFGVSLLRTVPHGSDEALASGIFLSESLYALSRTSSAAFSSGVFEVTSGIKLRLGICCA